MIGSAGHHRSKVFTEGHFARAALRKMLRHHELRAIVRSAGLSGLVTTLMVVGTLVAVGAITGSLPTIDGLPVLSGPGTPPSPQGSDSYVAFPSTTAGNDGTVEALDSMNGSIGVIELVTGQFGAQIINRGGVPWTPHPQYGGHVSAGLSRCAQDGVNDTRRYIPIPFRAMRMNQVENIGDGLAWMRKQRGWTQREAAKHLGVQQAAVARWESGGVRPPVNRVVEIARVYGFEVTWDLKPIDQALTEGVTIRYVGRIADEREDRRARLERISAHNEAIHAYALEYLRVDRPEIAPDLRKMLIDHESLVGDLAEMLPKSGSLRWKGTNGEVVATAADARQELKDALAALEGAGSAGDHPAPAG